MITDVEAQPEVGGENVTTGQLIRLSPQKFEELVKSLARSVHILQSVVANRSMEIQKGLRGRSIHRNKDPETTIGAREYGNPGVFEQTQMGGTEEMINDDTTATVASPEEAGRWVCQMLQNFHSLCAANGISKGSHVDSWAALRYLDWPFYCQLYTLANPRANTPVGRDHTRLPAVIRDLMEDDERRLILQKQVYVGLSRWWWCNGWTKSDPLIRQRGILDMGPWVSLIGMRLPNHVGEDDLLGPSSKDITRLLILVVLLHLPQPPVDSGEHSSNSAGTFWGDTVTVGQVLDLCYHQGVMKKPHTRDINGCRVHARELTCAIKLMNIWQRIGPPDLMAFTSVNDIRSMTLSSDLWDHIYDTRENGADANPECTADRLRCSDMSLEMLQELGKLRFEWTEFLDEHLSLDTEKLVLKIFWFGFAVKACPVFHIGCQKYKFRYCHVVPTESPIADALSDTYSLLFRSRKDTYKDNLAQYGSLPIPQWLRVFSGTVSGPLDMHKAKYMSYFLQANRPRVSDIEYHLARAAEKLPSTHLFKKYLCWETRLRQLKAHMDSQKPSGIRGLWADKRDSSQWFTFWAVVVIGTLGIVITSLGLIVSIIQTVGTFKGLQ